MLPPGFRLRLDPAVRRPRPGVLIGGSPLRVLRLSERGASLVEGWALGRPVASGAGSQALAGRLLDAGIAHPSPEPAVPGLARSVVTAVIPVRDRPEGLRQTLAAISGSVDMVVVVDDGSAVAVAAAVEELAGLACRVSVLRRDTPGGPARARNDGWRAARTEFVAFVDADCEPSQGWLDGLLPHFADPTVAAVAPRVVTDVAAGTPKWLGAYEGERSSLDLGPREAAVRAGSPVAYVPTAALLVRREALLQVGGFDESLRFGEDVDLVWRLAKAGWRVRYEPSVTARHPARRTFAAWLAQRYHYGRSAAPLAARHGRDVAPVAVSPWSAAAWALAIGGYPGGAAAVAAGTTAVLARRAGRDRATALALARLAAMGHLRAGAALAEAVRRAWLPPVAVALALALAAGRVRRLQWMALTAAFVAPPLLEWVRVRPDTDPATWLALRWADDLAYQAGVWVGSVDARSAGALLPRW